MTRRSSLFLRFFSVLLIAGEILLFVVLHRNVSRSEPDLPPVSELPTSAVPDLARQRHLMIRAEQALHDGDGAAAMLALETASFEPRPLEVYRRYYLANAKELVGERAEARAILEKIWSENPQFVRRIDVAFHLADLFQKEADWAASMRVLQQVGREGATEVREAAYLRARVAALAAGDPTSLVAVARALAIERPSEPVGRIARGDLEAMEVELTRRERIARVSILAATGEPKEALDEIARLKASGTTLNLERARAQALARTGKRDEADRIVLTFVGRSETLDRELLAASWGWWSSAARQIEERAWKSVRVRRRSGTTRVRVGGRWIDRPTYSTVTRRVKGSLNAADRGRLAAVNRKLVERGNRLLTLEIDTSLVMDIHRTLARVEMSPRRQERLEEHVRRLVEIDPSADDMLQLMWDEGWAAWRARDLDTARERFAFIQRTYRRAAVRRQAKYWYARCLEESGEAGEAARHFRELQVAAYDDVYSILARGRLDSDEVSPPAARVPFAERRDDWVSTAEREMPQELRLAWELSLVGLHHDARTEIRHNLTDENRSWAYSILARIHRAEGSPLLVSHALRVAWPALGTVEQDSVPVHFLRMYYPGSYHSIIEAEAHRHGLDDALVKALVLQESAYDPNARSGAGATGLMQLMAPTARELAPRVARSWDERSLVVPEYNVAIGTYYLRTLLTTFDDDPVLALAAYNGGIGNVRKWQRRELRGRAPDEVIESIPFSETRSYVKRVLFYRSVYGRSERP